MGLMVPGIPPELTAWLDALSGGGAWNSRNSREPASQRLAQWLDWTHSIELAAAVDRAGTAGPAADSRATVSGTVLETGRARMMAAVTALIHEAAAEAGPADSQELDPVVLRRAVARAQRLMEDGVSRMRAALRAQLSGTDQAGRALAEIDAVLEKAMADRMRLSLSAAQGLLPRLGQNAPAPWTRDRIVAALTAELELRLQPLRGLDQALQSLQLPSA